MCTTPTLDCLRFQQRNLGF
ncbi:unnamed protein product [Victoria cruziana]